MGGGMRGWMGLRVGFININDTYNNDVGKGGVRVYEAYAIKQRVALVRVPLYFINLLPTSLLYISILLVWVCVYYAPGGRALWACAAHLALNLAMTVQKSF